MATTTTTITTSTQNELLLKNLLHFYNEDDNKNLKIMMNIINGESRISLRIIDWFITNYSKLYYTVYPVILNNDEIMRFKVHDQYKNKLKSFSKKRFDIFCRHQRISIVYDKEKNLYLESTIAQLNCFKWVIENCILNFIEDNFDDILLDMNLRNSTNQSKKSRDEIQDNNKTRKKRQELSVSAVKTLKKEYVHIVMKFN
jgi:hypothetical protein